MRDTGKNSKTLKCSYCAKEFKYLSDKKRHEQSHTPQFKCQVCSKSFSYASALKRHCKQHERNATVICDLCQRTFRDQINLKRHIKYAHNETYTCSECSATFNSKAALQSHVKSHKPPSERKYRCRFQGCGKAFNFPHHLKHHELTHTGTKQHFCSVCEKGFIQLHHLKIHLKSHSDARHYQCSMHGCKQSFTNEYARKRHLAVHNRKKKTLNSNIKANPSHLPKDISCDSCGRIVARSDMNKHSSKCTKTLETRNESDILSQDINLNIPFSEVPLNLSKEEIDNELKIIENEANNVEKANRSDMFDDAYLITTNSSDIQSSCKTALGSCLANLDPNDNAACICDKIYNQDTNVAGCDQVSSLNKSEKIIFRDENDSFHCSTCECRKRENNLKYVIVSSTECSSCYKNNLPKLKYRPDGVIKLEETYDFDIKITEEIEEKPKDTNKSEVFRNSCKDVLGKCIVSGNDTIGDGCLCARMTIESQQDIEDITTYNKDDLFM